MDYFEKTLYTEKQFVGKFIEVETVGVELPDGKKATRDIIRHPGASVIMAVDSEKKIYMVRQFRKPIDKETLELPAGKLDFKGEDPQACAIRELKEETGLVADEINYITSIYSAPGILDEILHFYLARSLKQVGASPDEDEFLNIEKYTIEEALDFVMSGKIVDSKTIVGIMYLEKILNNTFKV